MVWSGVVTERLSEDVWPEQVRHDLPTPSCHDGGSSCCSSGELRTHGQESVAKPPPPTWWRKKTAMPESFFNLSPDDREIAFGVATTSSGRPARVLKCLGRMDWLTAFRDLKIPARAAGTESRVRPWVMSAKSLMLRVTRMNPWSRADAAIRQSFEP